jgi:hypothetical protein
MRFGMFFTSLLLMGCLTGPAFATDPDPSPPPKKKGFFSQLGDAVKQGVNDGVNNGIQTAGSVRILGYTMVYSKLARSNQRAYCLANADTGKLLTISPMFGSPYRRADGTTGFAEMTVPVDRMHQKIEVNMSGVIPGQSCGDMIARKTLTSYSANGLVGGGPVGAGVAAPVEPAVSGEDMSLLRKAAYEKCKPLLAHDTARMDAFKACFAEAIK